MQARALDNFTHGSYSPKFSYLDKFKSCCIPRALYETVCAVVCLLSALSSFQEIVQRECILYILLYSQITNGKQKFSSSLSLVFLMGLSLIYPQETCNIRDKMSDCFHGRLKRGLLRILHFTGVVTRKKPSCKDRL